MKINILDAHDRLNHFTKQSFSIAECVQDMIDQRPFGEHPFYIFAHTRTDDDGLRKRLIWQPRLTRPRAETNSMLFKAYPGTDHVKTFWIIPPQEMWAQYKKDNLTESKMISESIYNYKNNKEMLEKSEDDDLNDSQINAVYRDLCIAANSKKHFGDFK
jgi:hypothetical protein